MMLIASILVLPSNPMSTRGPGACSAIHANAFAYPAASLSMLIMAITAPTADSIIR